MSHTEDVVSVLQRMNQGADSPVISAVPVTDNAGKLLGTFSASNLKVRTAVIVRRCVCCVHASLSALAVAF